MKSLLIMLPLFILLGSSKIGSKQEKNGAYFVYETPTKISGTTILNFLKINSNGEIEVESFVIRYTKKIKRLDRGPSRKEKADYKLLDNGNLNFQDEKIAYSADNFRLLKSKARVDMSIKNKGLYYLLGEDFLNKSNSEKILYLMSKIKSGVYIN